MKATMSVVDSYVKAARTIAMIEIDDKLLPCQKRKHVMHVIPKTINKDHKLN